MPQRAPYLPRAPQLGRILESDHLHYKGQSSQAAVVSVAAAAVGVDGEVVLNTGRSWVEAVGGPDWKCQNRQ